jgi:hypothetical protein
MLQIIAKNMCAHMQVLCVSSRGREHLNSDWRKIVKEGVEVFIETGDEDDQQLAATLNSLGVTGSRFIMCIWHLFHPE